MVEQIVEEHTDQDERVGPIDSDLVVLPYLQEVPLQAIPDKVHDQPNTGYPVSKAEIYTSMMKRPNPLLEPSSYLHVMGKQLPKYEG